MSHEVLFGDDREIFVMIKEDNLEFEHILLQLRSKIALSLIWSPSFKSLQITSSFFFFVVTYDTRLLKNVPVPGLRSSYYSLRRLVFGRFMSIFQDMAHNHFGLLALQVCCIWYVGMCLNYGLSLASIISGFGLFFAVFRWKFL